MVIFGRYDIVVIVFIIVFIILIKGNCDVNGWWFSFNVIYYVDIKRGCIW